MKEKTYVSPEVEENIRKILRDNSYNGKYWEITATRHHVSIMSPETLAAYKQKKKLTKSEVAGAKSSAMDEFYKKQDSPHADKHVFRLAMARHKPS
ncbi:hypothetical protein Y032_0090g2371 [Ancylostoma ceylanicum]|uniref:Uncharacterized protein n=1 Tax=Ancylostoma ceylanicum TaxID=53326 RepID=A0A016TM17_9BILA|nr:hypothetical protein Y032_0090g2371 [Ancylostoma ceylanicum]